MALPGFKTTTTTRSVILDAAVQLVFMRLEGKCPAQRLDKLASISSGGTPSRNDPTLYGGEIPWAKIGDITTAGKWISETEENITQTAIEQSSARLFPKGTVFFSMYGSIGKTSIGAQPIATNQAILGLIPNSGIQSEYLYYALINARAKLFSQSKGTSQKNINGGMVKEFEIPLPPSNEIKKIVEYLSLVEEGEETDTLQDLPAYLKETRRIVMRIEALAQRVAEAQSLRREASEEADKLINSFVSHEWFSEKYPKGRFSDVLLEAKNGIYKPPDDWGHGMPCIRMYNIAGPGMNTNNLQLLEVTDEEFKTYGCKPGDLIFNRVNSAELVGKTGLITEDYPQCTFESKNIRLRLDTDSMLPKFAATILNSHVIRQYYLSVLKQQCGMATLNHTHLKNIPIPIPPLEEQRRLVAYLDGLQAQVSALRATQAETEKELSALMPSVLDRAFKGEL